MGPAPGSAGGHELRCPVGTSPNAERTPEVREAWCERKTDGKMHGPYKAWWPSGALGNAGEFANGEKSGVWLAWYKSGKLQARERYVEGRLIKGDYWSDDGKRVARPSTRS